MPIHLLAVAWFSLLTVLAVLRRIGVRSASTIGAIIGAFCVPAIIYLDYVQVMIIHAICSDCELAHMLGLILFALFVIMFRSDRKNRMHAVQPA